MPQLNISTEYKLILDKVAYSVCHYIMDILIMYIRAYSLLLAFLYKTERNTGCFPVFMLSYI